MAYGCVGEATELSRDVLDGSDPPAVARLRALVASASADGLSLRAGDARAAVEAAWPLIDANRSRFTSAEGSLHASICMVELAEARVTSARAVIDTRLHRALESDRGDLPGFWTLHDAMLLLYEGAARKSHAAQREALLILDRSDSRLSTPLARVGAAHAAVVMADMSDARRHLESVSPALREAPSIRSRVNHVRALLTALEEGLTSGARWAVAGGDQAAEDGHLLWAVEAWHVAVRLGSPDLVAGRLTEAATLNRGTVASLYGAHAEALAAGDTTLLEQVVRRFDESGFKLFAAEAASQICGLHRRRQQGRLARRAAVLARELLPMNSGVRTPAFAELPDLTPLTKREREVALLGAAGMTSKEIGERLYISVRSVDNHLSRVYTKLGVSRRSELAGVLVPEV